MVTSLSTFMKIAITVGTIALLLFGTAYHMLSGESDQYEKHVLDTIADEFTP